MKKLIVVIFACMTLFVGSALAFTKDGFYSLNSNDWVANSTPAGDVFVCSKCGSMVQVQISYGPKASKDSPFKNNDEFIKSFETEIKRKQFAEMLLKGSIPTEGYQVHVDQVGLSSMGGLKALQYAARVEMPGGYLSNETTMVAFHRDRIVKVTINYYDGSMNPEAKKQISKLLGTLTFNK